MKYVRIILGILLSVLVLVVLVSGSLFFYLKYSLLTPDKLSDLVTKEVNNQENIEFSCEKIELSYWDNWPFIDIVVKNGSILVQDKSVNVDTPFSGKFEKLSGTIELMKLWKDHVVTIDDILLVSPVFRINVQEKMPKISKNKKRSFHSGFSLEIDKIQVERGDFDVVFPKKGLEYRCRNTDILVEGNLIKKSTDFVLLFSSPQVTGTGIPMDFISFDLNCKGKVFDRFSKLKLTEAYFKINDFPFNLDGQVMDLKKGETPSVDLQFELAASSLEDLLAFVPSSVLPLKDNYQVQGTTALKGVIRGAIKKHELPDICIQGKLEQGKFHWSEFKEDLSDIKLDFELNYLSSMPDSSNLKLNHLVMKGMHSEIDLQGTVRNLIRDPYMEIQLKGNLDFDYIGKKVLTDKNLILAGTMKADTKFGCSLNDLKMKNYHLIKGAGQLEVKDVLFDHLKKQIHIYAPGVLLNFGYTKNTSNFIRENELLSAIAEVDTLYLSFQDKLFVNLGGLNLRSNTALSLHKDDVSPVTTHWNCRMLEARWNNSSIWTAVQNMELHAGVKPVGKNLLQGESGLMFKADKLKYLDPSKQQAFVFDKLQLMSEIRPSAKNMVGGEKHLVKGVLEFDQSQIYIPQFPMLTSVSYAYLSFQNNQLILNRMHVKAGKSDCMLSGSLSLPEAGDKRNAKSQVEGSLRILSSNIDYDELEKTFSYGSSLDRLRDSEMMQFGDLNNLEKHIRAQQNQADPKKRHPIYISKNLALELQLDVNHMNYRNVDLQRVQGNAVLKNQTLKTHLTTRTNLGKAELDLLYNSRLKEKVTACFDLKLQDFLVAQVHDVIPTVKTIFPLISSMDGLLNCRLTAIGELDNQMIPVLGATDAICSLDGHNLILMDNGTFKEIAHRFRFKNKEKNEISKLSANLILHKNRIEVIPFVLQWDRYRAIVGGEHSTDFTYNYHVDLIDSPIPIDFGLNLTGKEGQLKYKLSKCKYKDLFKKDGGILYNQQVDKRLNQIRQEIIKKL